MNTDQLIAEIKRGRRVFIDSETCSLHSIMVLLQWAVDDGEVHLWDVWKQPVGDTIKILDGLYEKEVVGFNLTFDCFHISKLRTMWELLPPDLIPETDIPLVESVEMAARDGKCFKPAISNDLMLHSRKNEFQTLMDRKDVRIRKVPAMLADALVVELEKRVEIPDIYFAGYKDKQAARWRIFDVKDHPNFKDVVLKFRPRGGLKFLAEFAMGLETPFHFSSIEVPKEEYPQDFGYAPTAYHVRKVNQERLDPESLAVEEDIQDNDIQDNDYRPTSLRRRLIPWPEKVQYHINHWANNPNAREYARLDIVYTRKLWEFFGKPEGGDDDSELAAMVAAVRWHGYEIDLPAIQKLKDEAQTVVDASRVNVNRPSEVRAYLEEIMDEYDLIEIAESTAKPILKKLADREDPEDQPVAERCREILAIKKAVKEIQLYEKLLFAERLHADFKVIGTKSSRMSGGGGLNVQAINADTKVRKCFTLKWDGMELSLGDFSSFEVTIAEAVFNDPDLRKCLLEGQKLHGLFGTALYPGMTYEEILATDGTEDNKYTKAKGGVFALLYFGDAGTLSRNLGLPLEQCEAAIERWFAMFPKLGEAMNDVRDKFESMKQPDGIGTAIIWEEPATEITTFLGFTRYFTLETEICRQLFKLAQAVPQSWKDIPVRVVRRDRMQTASGATGSALYAAAFGLQGANLRAAGNHLIQSPGAQICKNTQRRVWDLQPAGFQNWHVAPMNVHDEIECAHKPELRDAVVEKINSAVEDYKAHVPLIAIDWKPDVESWAGKKDG